MSDLKAKIKEISSYLQKSEQVWVAYSGGLDSSVLLHLLVSMRVSVKALHINHQLSVNADSWQQHCISTCNTLGCELSTVKVEVENSGKGLEHAARNLRYQVFATQIKQGDTLLTAHHLDDECETLLFRLLRGSGLRGLSGIPNRRLLPGGGVILRPFLTVNRVELLRYAQTHNVNWVDDESNQSMDFDRNYIRHKVFPLVQSRWPNFTNQFGQAIRHLREADHLLLEYGQGDLASCELKRERLGQSICLVTLKKISSLRLKHVLRVWLQSLGYSFPSQIQMSEIEKIVWAKAEAKPCVSFGDCEIRRFQNRFYCIPRLVSFNPTEIIWNPQLPLTLPDGSQLALIEECKSIVRNRQLKVFFRTGGERCRPIGRRHSQTLKKLLQEYQVEPWLRDRVPLVSLNDQIIAVGDLWLCDANLPNNELLQFSWRYNV